MLAITTISHMIRIERALRTRLKGLELLPLYKLRRLSNRNCFSHFIEELNLVSGIIVRIL